MTLANVNGLPVKARFKVERDEGMEDVADSRFLTLVIDLIATLLFIGLITLQIKWRVYPSDYAVKLTNINKEYKGDIEKDIRKYFEPKYGKIHEVAVIKETGDILKYQMELHRITEMIGDLKARNEHLGKSSSKKLLRAHTLESKLNDKLSKEIKRVDQAKLEIGGANIKEVYVIFEKPVDKNKLIQNPIEVSEFIDKAKDPKKKRFM